MKNKMLMYKFQSLYLREKKCVVSILPENHSSGNGARATNVTYVNSKYVLVGSTIPVPTREENCAVWAEVENKCTRDCN